MSNDRKIYKPGPIRGFPEWLPEERLIEQKWFDNIRRVFESYGFCNIETPSVEELDVLAAKGEVDKEIYVIERLHKDENDKKESRLALHFDQTVPLARYVAQNFNDLVFPFKRYQMQRVWRGERPQMGRMREFYQCDIDVINIDSLPISFDAEVASMMYEVLESLNIGRVQLRISNRKIYSGVLAANGVKTLEEQAVIFGIIDKIEKLPKTEFNQKLETALAPYEGEFSKPTNDIKTVISYQNILKGMGRKEQLAFIAELITALNTQEWIAFEQKYQLNKIHYFYHDFGQGFCDLYDVLSSINHLPDFAAVADLSI
ncbi:MAG: ATP phosphoribosyltransferase regulatory subunit, partial [Alphaproteobacteria bacterium]|nr:ATP phosphoribosyltransferase regulatory subunit [Alphaproteobacteria bacterium]